MEATTVAKQIEEIRQSAETMDAAKTETIGTASVGDVVRQGDLYLVCIADAETNPTKDRQLAPGTTQGSRHIVKGRCVVGIPDREAVASAVNAACRGAAIPTELVGPVIHCKGAVTITHPEHGHKVLPAGSTWATVYQRAYGEEIRRVQD